jgi:hypothetical protein
MAKYSAIAIAAAAATAGVFIKKSIDAAKEAEAMQAKINATLMNTKFSADESAKAMKRAAAGAMELGFDDEQAQLSMAKFLQVTKDQTMAAHAQYAAYDLSRAKGIDLESSTKMITMAMMGSTRVLKEYGIEVADNASKQEILDAILSRVGGTAEEYGATFAGAQERIKVSIENVQEQIGEIFLPILTNLFNKISNFVQSEKFIDFIKNLGTKIQDAGKNIKEIYEVMLPVFQATFSETFGVVNELVKSMNGNLAMTKGQFSAIDYAIAPIIGLILAVNKAIEYGAGLMMGFKLAATKIAEVFEGWYIIIKNINSALSKSPVDFISDKIKGKASGGYVQGGTPYMVGERGPELFVPGQSGNIVPNNKMSGGVNINFNNPVVRSDSDLNRIITEVKRVLNREQVVAGLRI